MRPRPAVTRAASVLYTVMGKPLLTVILACSVLTGRTLGSPKHLWPLTKKTVYWDQQNDDNPGSLVSDGSSQTCPYVVSDTPFSHGSFYYDGAGSSVADFPIPESGTFDSFGFTLWLKPDSSAMSTTSVIFVYKANASPSNNKVNWVRAELVNGKVQMSFGESSNVFGTLQSSGTLSTSQFTSILLSVDKNEKKMYVTLDNDEKRNSVGREYPIQVPGTWRVGGSWINGDAKYIGKITCIGFFDFYVDHNDHQSEYRCTESYDPKNVPSCSISPEPQPTTTTTTATTTTTTTTTTTPTTTTIALTTAPEESTSSPSPSPRHLWPLDNVTRGSDVITGSAPMTSSHKVACLRTADAPDASLLPMTRPSLFFDGSWRSVLVFPMNESALGADFMVMLFVKPELPAEGHLWSYATYSGSFYIEVGLDANASIVVKLWEGAVSTLCGHAITSKVWGDTVDAFVTVVVRKNTHELTVEVNGSMWSQHHTCSEPAAGSGSGSLTVAGRGEDGGAGFRGSLVCLAVFSEDFPSLAEGDVLDLCHTYSNTFNTVPDVCDLTPNLQTRKFRLLEHHAEPSSMMQLAPMTSLQTSSAAQCACDCIKTAHCCSFTIVRQNGTSSCRLYDFVTFTGLSHSPGSSYYEIRS